MYNKKISIEQKSLKKLIDARTPKTRNFFNHTQFPCQLSSMGN